MNKKWIVFLLIYSVSIFLVFVYMSFPIESLKRKIENAFSDYIHGQLSINEISLHFPAHLKMKKLQINIPKHSKEGSPFAINLDELKVGLGIKKMLKGRIGLDLDLLTGNGKINAKIDKKWIGHSIRYLTVDIKDLSIQDFPVLDQQFGIHITGLMTGKADIEWPGNDITTSKGEWAFNIEKGRIIPKHFPAFAYDSAYGNGVIKEQAIQIEKIQIQGQDLSLTANGQIRMETEISNFFIDTKVKLKLFPKLYKRLGFFTNLLPKPDNEGYINLFIYGPPGALRFSSKERG
ncbi:type II secretion system protein GspN [bacterium]|nr:type II secretion system protein GspN [bacterium]